MTGTTERPAGLPAPHGCNSPLPGIVRERIVFGNSLVGGVETVSEPPEAAGENDNILEDDGSHLMPPLADATPIAVPTRATQNKFKFSKQKVLGNLSPFDTGWTIAISLRNSVTS